MKKFSKVLLIFALVSVVLLGVLVSCEEPEIYDFADWKSDMADYEWSVEKYGVKEIVVDKKVGAEFPADGVANAVIYTDTTVGSATVTALENAIEGLGLDSAIGVGAFDLVKFAGLALKADKPADVKDWDTDVLAATGPVVTAIAGKKLAAAIDSGTNGDDAAKDDYVFYLGDTVEFDVVVEYMDITKTFKYVVSFVAPTAP